MNVVNPDQFFRLLRGRCQSTIFVAKLPTPALITLAFRNGMGYRYLDVRINSANHASISCENFVKFSPVTPELTELICERQATRPKKLMHLVEYLRIGLYWTDFRNLSTIWKHFTWDDGSVPYFPICQGTLPWQPNNFAKMLSTPIDTTFIRCSVLGENRPNTCIRRAAIQKYQGILLHWWVH